MEYTDTLKKAIETFGKESQTLMCFEEMAELQKELCKHARGAENVGAIAEEIADVEIMLEQLKIMHNCHERVDAWKEQKIKRLEDRLNGKDERRRSSGHC